MIVTCTNCDKRYMIEESALSKIGRKVRCIACGNVWKQDAQEASTKAIEDAQEAPQTLSTSSPLTLRLGWAGFFLAFVGTLSGLFVGREQIMRVFPSTNRLYETVGLGLTPPATGLAIQNTVPMQVIDGEKTFVIVKGEIQNLSSEMRHIPGINISLRGDCSGQGWGMWLVSKVRRDDGLPKGQCTLSSWSHKLYEDRLFPNERVTFETPPKESVAGATDIVVRF